MTLVFVALSSIYINKVNKLFNAYGNDSLPNRQQREKIFYPPLRDRCVQQALEELDIWEERNTG